MGRKWNPVASREAAGGRYLQSVGAVKYEITRWVCDGVVKRRVPVQGEPLLKTEQEAKARVGVLGADYGYWPVVNR